MRKFVMAAMVMGVVLTGVGARAEEYVITIKDHKFTPAELTIPAGKRVKVVVDNQDSTPEEFESHDFNREKIIPGKSKGVVFVGPLKAGSYNYFGEFNQKTAQGKIIAQ